LYLRSDVYVIDEMYVDRISPDTTVGDFINNCETNGIIKVYDETGKLLGEDDIVGTGMYIRVSGQLYHKLAVTGDLDGNGIISVTDLAKQKLAYIGRIEIENEFKLAADINYDQKLTITDVAKMKQAIIGLIDL